MPFILNDRPDLAADAQANGVHLGQHDQSPADARLVLGNDAIIGLSTHGVADLEAAERAPVDYVAAGPVHATPTVPGRRAVGTRYVTEATTRATRPLFAIGGVTPETIPAMVVAGARRVAVVRYLTDAADPERHARQLVDSMRRALASDRASGQRHPGAS